jgi:hypothetical protein
MPPTHADRIRLSEIREQYFYVCDRPDYNGETRRRKLERAVALAQLEHAEAAQYVPLTDAEWAALHTPVVATDGEELPW